MKIKQFFTTKDDGNIAYHVTTHTQEVDDNRKALGKKYAFNSSTMRYMEQTHGNNVHIITKDSPLLTKDCDALMTNVPNTALMVMVADCIPILLHDTKKGVIAAVHAGRNSTFLKITSKTVKMMIETFGCNPEDIEATFGPSIQVCCYEVSEELAHIVKQSFGKEFVHHERYIDLQGINTKLLKELNVTNIRVEPVCTKCSHANYFSYRLDKACGRFAGIITIEK
ncbi:MAG: peptidoglycan editing factor PgeF [Arcobacteraceae bacterium]